jgi:ferritin-like protein
MAVSGFSQTCDIFLFWPHSPEDSKRKDRIRLLINEEIEHESWFSEFLGEGPSGHFLRRGETSPFVSKFLR